MVAIQNSPSGAAFEVKIHPRAKRNAITGEVGDALKLSLTAPPVDGKANAELCVLFARQFKVSKTQITIKSGAAGRVKLVEIAGL